MGIINTSDMEDEFICECGEDSHVLLLTIDDKCMCQSCIQKMINKLRKNK